MNDRRTRIYLAVAIVSVVLVLGWVTDLERMDQAASVGALVLAVWIFGTADRDARRLDPAPGRIVEALAEAALQQATVDAALIDLREPRPMRVTWTAAAEVSAHPADVLAEPDLRGRAVRLRGGGTDEFAARFLELPHRQAVVIGEPGSGKSVLALRVVLGVLKRRAPHDPVPLRVPLAGLSPEQPVEESIRARMVADYPNLESSERAAAMIDTGRIVLVLDGLDEVDSHRQQEVYAALRELSARDVPFLLTCRSADYRKLPAVEGVVLSRAAVLEIQPVAPVAAVDYLCGPGPSDVDRWRRVVEHLVVEPDGPLTQVLSSPLYLFLARRVYARSGTDPNELLRLGDAGDIRSHLDRGYLPAVFDISERERAVRSLSFIARFMSTRGRDELAWWDVRNGITPWVRALLGGVVGGLVAAIVAGVVYAVALVVYLSIDWTMWPNWPMCQYAVQAGAGTAVRVGPAFGTVLAVAACLRRARLKPIVRSLRWRGLYTGNRTFVIEAAAVLAGAAVAVGWGVMNGEEVLGNIGAFVVLGAAVVALRLRPVPARSAVVPSPRSSLLADRQGALRQALSFGLLITGGSVLMFSDDDLFLSLTGAPSIGATGGVVIALARTSWGQWATVSRPWLWLAGFRRPLTFLAEAHHRGVLRQAGAGYQFRHESLRRFFTRPVVPDQVDYQDRASQRIEQPGSR